MASTRARVGVGATAVAAGAVAGGNGWSLPAPWWLHLVAGMLTAGSVVLVAVAGRRLVQAARRPSPAAVVAVAAAVLVGIAVVAPTAPPPAVPITRTEVAEVLRTPVAPAARTSGAPGSLVDRASLGPEGRAFVDEPPGPGATRAYVGTAATDDERDRVLLGLREWVTLGGLQHASVLVVVPTGSGWVNEPAVRAAEQVAGGDLTTLVVQYAARPSWLELALDRDRATRVAQAVVQGVLAVVEQLPEGRRPDVVLFGESLGAEAVAAATGPGVAACLAAGRPGAALPAAPTTSCTDVANADDPVASWSTALLWSAPRGLPLVSFWRTTAELLVALDQGVGHGHSYLGSVAPAWAAVWPQGPRARRAPAGGPAGGARVLPPGG